MVLFPKLILLLDVPRKMCLHLQERSKGPFQAEILVFGVCVEGSTHVAGGGLAVERLDRFEGDRFGQFCLLFW